MPWTCLYTSFLPTEVTEQKFNSDVAFLSSIIIFAKWPGYRNCASFLDIVTCMCYFPVAEKTPGDGSLERLCGSLSRLATVEPSILQNWLRHVILGGASPSASLPTPTTTLIPASPQQSESPASAATPTGGAAAPPPPPPPLVATPAGNGKSESGAQIASSESNSSSHSPTEEHQGLLQENHLLLQGLTAYIVKENR